MANSPPFIHLHNHSEYSLLDGACTVQDLVGRAKGQGMSALALTDHGNMFGAIEFYTACQEAGIKPILGMEAYLNPAPRTPDGQRPREKRSYHLLLLVKDRGGYHNLMRLASIGYVEGFYYKPRIDKEDLRAHSEGLICSSACQTGEIPQLLLARDWEGARRAAAEYREIFGPEGFYLELQDHGLPQQKAINEGIVALSEELNIPLVATNDVHYLTQDKASVHDILLCVQTGKDLDDPDRLRFAAEELYFKEPEEMARLFPDHLEALENTAAIADQSNLDLELDALHLPELPIPPGYADLDEYLVAEAEQGLEARVGRLTQEYRDRLRDELDIIRNTRFAGYFLIVRDFIATARKRDIPVGPGRGSSAGSLVAYALGITDIDPLEHGLIFERFLNPERVTAPDIDIDFCYERRGEIIHYAKERYGEENVAQIITFGRMLARAVVRDVGRVRKIPYDRTDHIAKLIPSQPGYNLNLREAVERVPELRELYDSDGEIRQLLEDSTALEGLARHASVHAAGVVISPTPLINHVPLYRTNKKEFTTQYDMKSLEKIGLLKIDLLGLRTLTVLSKTVQAIQARHGKTYDLRDLPLDDAETYRLLAEGHTSGVFQFEGTVPTDVLKRLKPGCFEDIVAVNALIRPGALQGMTEDFIERKRGRRPIHYLHPALEPILKETCGVITYQEQVMEIAARLAGFSMAQADLLRRAMGKKKPEEMARMKGAFVEGAVARQISRRDAEEIFSLMDKFSGYGFNKCLTEDAQIEMADGTVKPITEVREGDLVLTRDGPARARSVRPSGIRRVGRLRLANGMTIRCTPDHPVFTQRGWVNAEDLTDQDFVAVARELPCGSQSVPAQLPALLGYALAEGSLGYDSHFYLYSNDPDELADMAGTVTAFPNTDVRVESRTNQKTQSVRPVRIDPRAPSRAVEFLFQECGLQGKTALAKRLPGAVERWNRDTIAVLVGKLFQGDGCVHPGTRSIFYATSSEDLATDVRRLLLKLGISSTVHRKKFAYRDGPRVGYTVNLIGGRSAYAQFQTLVGQHLVGKKREALAGLVASYAGMPRLLARGTVEVVPLALCRQPLREEILKRYPSLKAGCRALGITYRLMFKDGRKRGIRRDTLAYVAEALDSLVLRTIAESSVAWSRPREFVLEGVEPTYDFEVPGARNFLANGIVVHNSHSVAYTYLSYATAFFKCHYPREFMAALLTSEMSSSDKIVKYIADCREQGIEVLAPDVNESEWEFTVVDRGIRFGLGAIKNVGQRAVESIIRSREEGEPFKSLYDFCERIDLRLNNKRVLESLIQAGGLDSLGGHRAQLSAGLDQALQVAQRRRREREAGQIGLFLEASEESTGDPPLPETPPWSTAQKQAFEKILIGFYISGHPLDPYRDVLAVSTTATTADLPGLNGEPLLLGGIITQMRRLADKRGNEMAFLTLEDFHGTIELIAFSEAFQACRHILQTDAIVLVRGTPSARDQDEPRLIVEKAWALPDLKAQGRLGLCLQIPGRYPDRELLREAREILSAEGDDIPLYLQITNGNSMVRLRSQSLKGTFRASVVSRLRELLGEENVRAVILEEGS